MEKIFADFNNTDKRGNVRLNCHGSQNDIECFGIALFEGKELRLTDEEEIEAKGILHFSTEENIWVAKIDWNKLHRKA